MNLGLADLFDDVRRKAGISDSPASQRAFMRALLSTLGEVNPRWGTEYAPDSEDAPDGSITIESYQYAAIVHGIRFYLQQSGAWAMDTDAEAWEKFDMHTRRAIGSAIADDDEFLTRNSVPDDE
jgi:hypothetical protein